MRRFIEDFKMKNIAFFLLFFLLVSGHSNANAVGGSIGGWRITSNVAQGIGAKITATKDVVINGVSKAVTSSATVLPKAANVGKFMGKNLGAAAVIGAMDLLLDGVDYVMDPANNSVTYKDKNSQVDPKYSSPNIFYSAGGDFYSYISFQDAAQQKWNQWHSSDSHQYQSLTSITVVREFYSSGNLYTEYRYNYRGYDVDQKTGYTFMRMANPEYDPSVKDEPKTVPLSDVASQVLDQAEKDIKAGNPASPAVVLSRAVAQDMIQEAEADDVKARPIAQELEKNPEYPSDTDAEGEITKPEVIDPATGEVVKPAETSSIAMKFPKACEWFPQACLFIDWAMTDPDVDSDMEVPEKEIEKQEIKKDLVKISGRSCPSDVKFDVHGLPFGTKINKSYSMQEICNAVEPLKYVFELVTAFICAMILLRV